VWRAFAGRVGIVLGVAAAGLAFAMQEVIGALAGGVNIVSGRIYRIGDRVELAGVHGDVVDITPLRTKVMEIGGDGDNQVWVRGRQLTGRIVAISNKKTFTEPVFNYSAALDFVWEEVTVPVAYRADMTEARRILEEELRTITDHEAARRAIEAFVARYPVHRADVEPRVFGRLTSDYLELAARFPVPVRMARTVKDDLSLRVLQRYHDAGLEIASTTQDVTVRPADDV
jgi:small-conductance mechanosensitive channel